MARDAVLTAAHCKTESYKVVVGRHDLGEQDGKVLNVTKQVVHPDYNDQLVRELSSRRSCKITPTALTYFSVLTAYNDFMIVWLDSPADSSYGYVAPNSDSSSPSVGSSVTTMG